MCCKGTDYVEKSYVKLLTVTSVTAVECILPLLFDSPLYNFSIYCDLMESQSEYTYIIFYFTWRFCVGTDIGHHSNETCSYVEIRKENK